MDAPPTGAGWHGVVAPEDEEDGKREGRHVDPDGNVIRFAGPPG